MNKNDGEICLVAIALTGRWESSGGSTAPQSVSAVEGDGAAVDEVGEGDADQLPPAAQLLYGHTKCIRLAVHLIQNHHLLKQLNKT